MLEKIKKHLSAAKFKKMILNMEVHNNHLIVQTNAEELIDLLKHLKLDENCQFRQLVSICGADYPQDAKRFEVIYSLLSHKFNARILLKVKVADDEMLPSACDVYKSALWYERETYDMYGVVFADNPDMRRILTDYGFEGHPLRKDFPLTGHVEMRYDYEKKKVVYEPVQLTQEFRNFDFQSPWEGTQYQLPGDEKASK
jgi:NADH-quinone oxidoreductase subunit C